MNQLARRQLEESYELEEELVHQLLFSFFLNFYWSIAALQCCVSFYYTAK